MIYPDETKLRYYLEQLHLYAQLKYDYGAAGVEAKLTQAEQALAAILEELKALPDDPILASQEPDDLAGIRSQRPAGPRRIWQTIDPVVYRVRLEGALLGRLAGCLLGGPVEGCSISFMEELARENGDPFPLVDYWKRVPQPFELHNERNPREDYTRAKMNGVPVDDDTAYTVLGLFVAEQYGPDFSTQDIGRAWMQYLPFAYSAEETALKNLKAGVPALEAGVKDNPFTQWIGADIRADPWAYIAPGYPELAAELAYRDACLSHRRQGIYGAMFFAAAISAAFTVQDPLQAIRIGLTEIPAECQLAQHVRWALAEAPHIKKYRQARQAVDERFVGMSSVHTVNNACLTIFGLAIGGTDFTRVIGETVAMGMDNDCTTATGASLLGAVLGKAGIPEHWTRNFNDTLQTYLIGAPRLSISDVIERFCQQAVRFSQ